MATPPAESGGSRSRARLWRFRAAAVLFPFVLVAAAEAVLRLAGAFEPDPWANEHVVFEAGEPCFPEWKEQFAAPKSARAFRIFVLGESSVVGKGIPRRFTDILQEQLSVCRPDLEVQVVNAGLLAVGSHRIFQVMKEAAAAKPDLLLLYFGHNEFLEEIFFDPEGWVARKVRQNRFANQFRVVRAVRSLLGLGEGVSKPILASTFPGDGVFPLIRSPEQYRLRLEFLRDNLRQMIRFSRSIGCPLLVSPAVANLLWWPGSPQHGGSCRRAECDALMARGGEHFRKGEWREAADTFARLGAEVDDGFAPSHYFLGVSLTFLGETERGLAELTRANLLDRHGNRSNAEVREAILSVCREEGVPVLDLHDRCHARIPEDARRMWSGGEGLFFDHCHPSPEGHAFFASAFAEAILAEMAKRPR